MKAPVAKWWLVISGIVLIALVVLFGVARRWLESAGGQALLQRELSSRLGMAVTIDAGYQLGFFPSLSIEGTGLAVAGRNADTRFVSSDSFEVGVALVPLFRQEVKMTSIELVGGILQLDQSPETHSGDDDDGNSLVLPEIAELIVRDFAVRVSDEGVTVDIDRLALAGFQQGVSAPIELQASLAGASEPVASFELEGRLTVDAEPLSTRLEIERLELYLGGLELLGMNGALNWTAVPAKLDGRLAWAQEQRRASIELEMQLEEASSGEVRGHYADAQVQGKVATEFSLLANQQYLQLDGTQAELEGQAVQGNGCLAWDETVALRLMLASEELDLDRLQALVPASGGDAPAMPLELDVSLAIARAKLKGAEAWDVQVLVGKEPHCP